MKYYAVKKGRQPGVYTSWDACQEQIKGYSNASFKSFTDKAQAQAFVNGEKDQTSESACGKEEVAVAYVDGSYNLSDKRYGFGGIVLYQGESKTFYGGGERQDLLEMRNVSGEMMAAMRAVTYAIEVKAKALEIHYDYQGIGKWVSGEWQAKNAFTQAYRDYMREKGKELAITYIKVKAHSNDHYNDIADQLAKKGSFVNK